MRLILFAAALTVLAASCETSEESKPSVDAVVTVRGASVVRTVEPGLILGANFGAWVGDTKLGTTTRDLVKALRPSVARFPGGNMSNNFCWETQRVSGNDHLVWEDWSWGIDVAEFMAFVKTIGAVPMFSLIPFDHTIDGRAHFAVSEAVDLARLFVSEGFPGAYYEVGNENDGSWNPMLSINDYTDTFVRLARAVKTIDPAAQFLGPVGSYMSTVTGFLDRLGTVGGTALLDWVSYHHYGGWISNGNSNGINLDDPQAMGDEMAGLRADLNSRGLSRVKIAVTEINAAIWDTGCARDQFTIKQGLWLADALGVSFRAADMVNVWIHLHPGTDPHTLIDSESDPPQPTRNYWPVALAAQTLSGTDPTQAVEVLAVDVDRTSSVLTAYAVRKPGAGLGVLLVNKSAGALMVAVDLPFIPGSVTAQKIDAAGYAAAAGPSSLAVSIDSLRATLTVPATSIVGLDVR